MGARKLFSFPTSFFDTPEIKLIEAMPGGDGKILILLELVLASDTETPAYLICHLPRETSDHNNAVHIIAENVGRPVSHVAEALSAFEELGFLMRGINTLVFRKFWCEDRKRSGRTHGTGEA